MLKKRVIGVLVGIALLTAVVGSSGIVADALGFQMTPQAYMCHSGGSAGGGC